MNKNRKKSKYNKKNDYYIIILIFNILTHLAFCVFEDG